MGYMSKEPKIKPIVIVGAGGMGRDTQWLIERINEEEPTYEILGYIDDGILARQHYRLAIRFLEE